MNSNRTGVSRGSQTFPAILICSIALLSLLSGLKANAEFLTQRASFSVECGPVTFPYRVASLFVMPGDTLALNITSDCRTGAYDIACNRGEVMEQSAYRWKWVAPTVIGNYDLIVRRTSPPDSICFVVFVMVPLSEVKEGRLNGYRIGAYPGKPYKDLPQYRPPRGLIEVTRENESLFISPHFQLWQFLCKQDGDYPKYVALRARLLLKLELILQKVNEKGYHCGTFAILSGYRTPYYNRRIGNVKYSRHLWGGAADIFIDEDPKDDVMDDLNRDGQINWRDAAIVYDIIDDMYGTSFYQPFIGGLGRYRKTPAHGPFVHVDVRGFRARWGD